MDYFAKSDPAGVSGRVYEHARSSAGCTTSVPESCSAFDVSAMQHDEQSNIDSHAGRLDCVKEVLRRTAEHVTRSNLLIADMQNSISSTLRILRTSQQLLSASDLAIARSTTLDSR